MNDKTKLHLEKKFAQMGNQSYGEQIHIFANNTEGELYLPRETKAGKKFVQPKEQFVGDSYYFSMVPNQLIHVSSLNEQLLTEIPPAVGKPVKESRVKEPQLLTETPVDGVHLI